jgi:hypothetical protein
VGEENIIVRKRKKCRKSAGEKKIRLWGRKTSECGRGKHKSVEEENIRVCER